MDDIERKRRIYEELVADAKAQEPIKQDGEFSVNDFANAAGLGKDYAKKVLEEKFAVGILTKRKTTRGVFYSPM